LHRSLVIPERIPFTADEEEIDVGRQRLTIDHWQNSNRYSPA